MRGILCTGEKKCMPTIRSRERASPALPAARAHGSAAGGRGLRDAGPHEAETDDTDIRDRTRLPEALKRRFALTEREHDERRKAASGLPDGELAKRARLPVEARGDALGETDRD